MRMQLVSLAGKVVITHFSKPVQIMQMDGWIHHRDCSDENSSNSGASNSSLIPHDQWVHVLLTNDGTISRSYANGFRLGPVQLRI